MKYLLFVVLIGCSTYSNLLAQDGESPRFSRDYSYTKEKQPDPATPPPPPTEEQPTTLPNSPPASTTPAADSKTPSGKPQKPAPNDSKNAAAQIDTAFYYTYTTDRRYNVIQEVDGEKFYPSHYQSGGDEKMEVPAGKIALTVQKGFLKIDGIEGLTPGMFSIISKTEQKVGFVYELMDKKNQPARFKIVIDQTDKYVVLLYFYSKILGEYTFYLAEKTDEQHSIDASYFTPKSMYFVRSYGNLVDKELHPYTMVKDITMTDKPSPIKQADNITIRCTDTSISLPEGSFDIKEANSYAYNLDGFPSVRSMIEIKTKGKSKIGIFLNFKQQIEFIQIGNTRYFLKP
jgi:hypothetical protein